MNWGSSTIRKYIAEYVSRIVYHQKIYCLVCVQDCLPSESILLGIKICFQDTLSSESILPGMISGSFNIRKYIAWYYFRILYHQKVHCLVLFQDPLPSTSILPGMISGPFTIIMYAAWYCFRILCRKKVHCLV